MNNRIFLLGSLLFLFSCNDLKNDTNTYEKTAPKDSILVTNKVTDIEPRLWEADSLQILYYDNPDGDSLRYARFFTYTETNDSLKVNSLLKELNQVFIQHGKPKNCRSEGKLFLLNKADVLKTIYFSTRGDTCSYLYFIKDGGFIYFPLSENAKKFLIENKSLAHKP